MQFSLTTAALVLSAISTVLAYSPGAAIAAARHEIGTPYVWGGGHGAAPGKSGGGYDCSGLVRYAVSRGGGPDLNGSTRTQVNDRRLFAINEADRRPGDLQFFSPGNIHHVVLYAGNSGGRETMIEAQQTGVPVHEVTLRRGGVWRRVR
ncbi:hypothetical protein BGW38_009836 [Lunasporangiospora selenospora]|uniref:NlpC/P60 domain-containing protein n=1 Tax=Lunasporangiospora selenospora TaxID=979761 RepID=A0A9P6G224_9FUNG|nr:hypothetical protein BGW38_009836 [Lunasporangiospora selenospora]